MKKGKKFDQGKTLAGMVHRYFANSLNKVFEVGTFGAQKYGRDNWLELEGAETRYHDALYRHLNAHERGEVDDTESGLPHLVHAAWNILALIELNERSYLDK